MIIGIVFIVVVIVIGIFMLRKSKKTEDVKDTVKKEEISPTEKPEQDHQRATGRHPTGTRTDYRPG